MTTWANVGCVGAATKAVRAVPGRLAALRVLLLAPVAFGVLGMHTLGHHPGAHAGAGVTVGHVAGAHAVAASAVGHIALGPSRPAERGLAGIAVPPAPPRDHPDPTAVCLAILTAAGLTVLVAGAWLAPRRGPAAGRIGLATVAGLGRAPPPLGLLLARLSVLRT